jgi:hypothetical protein
MRIALRHFVEKEPFMIIPLVVVVTVAATLDQWRMGAGGMGMCHDSYQDDATDILLSWMG